MKNKLWDIKCDIKIYGLWLLCEGKFIDDCRIKYTQIESDYKSTALYTILWDLRQNQLNLKTRPYFF